jgi:hypothetical protein
MRTIGDGDEKAVAALLAAGVKAMSAFGVKQTTLLILGLSAYDPDRTSVLQRTNWPVAKCLAYLPD